ncbi:pseudouridylate synthase 1 homolog isoform X2 [Ylistrum balloti]|nr:pseudouridylate synthase 1 homolog isoform X2 [Ylistrum balloti]
MAEDSEKKIEDTGEVKGEKRKLESEEVATSFKREKTEQITETDTETAPLKKKKVALLLSYSGKGFFGLQKQKDLPTIEGTLIKALLDVGVITKEDGETPQKMWFQRAARTDKGVSAAGNMVSLKMSLHVENFIEEINKVLPEQIKVQACIRTTKGFDSKNFCDGRTYSYLTPTFAFAPRTLAVTEGYRIPNDTVQRIREIIKRFEGTHNFHNFTSGLKPTEARAKRYIIDFQCGDPFVRDDIEFVQLTVRGQSFMLHHIRKMIGLTMAIVRGHCDEEVIDKSYSLVKIDVPRAPGSGLMLEELHYTGYNKRYGSDGLHQKLSWSDHREAIDKFKEEHIYPEMIRSEKEELSMKIWLGTLEHHDYDEIPPEKLLNWKYKDFQNEELSKKEKSASTSENQETTEEKDIKISSNEIGKEDESNKEERKLADKDMEEKSGDTTVNNKDKNKMEVS